MRKAEKGAIRQISSVVGVDMIALTISYTFAVCRFLAREAPIPLHSSTIYIFAMSALTARTASVSRKTNETQIEVSLNLDCGVGSTSEQVIDVSTGIGFLDHVRCLNALPAFEIADDVPLSTRSKMYHALAKHSGMSLTMKCKGDLWIDDHHTADEYNCPGCTHSAYHADRR